MVTSFFRALGPVAFLVAGAVVGGAQTLIGVTSGGLQLHEVNGHPHGPCAWPDPHFPQLFDPGPSHPCVGVPPLEPYTDVASLPSWNEVWVTEGTRVVAYEFEQVLDAPIESYPPTRGFTFPLGTLLPGPIVALGGEAAPGVGMLAVSDGSWYAVLALPAPGVPLPPNVPFCGAPALVVGPTPLPGIGTVTDIDIDVVGPGSFVLWAVTTDGMLVSFDAGGVIGSAFLGDPDDCHDAGPGPPPVLTGVALDRADPGVVYVASATRIARIFADGSPAPSTFAFPTPCLGALNAAGEGLAYTARGNTFGNGLGSSHISTIGQPVVGNATFGIVVTGALDAVFGAVYVSTGFLCPELFVSTTVTINLATVPQPLFVSLAAPVSPTTIVAPIPLVLPNLANWIGTTFYFQVLGYSTAQSINGPFTSEGLAITLAGS